MRLEVGQERLAAEIEELATISEAEPPAVTRIVFTPTDLKARAWIRARCEAAGLTLRQDPVGNLFARWQGTNADAPAVGTGSHIDAIPNAGKFDGVVGVLGGLEAIRSLQRSGFRPTHSIELIVFTSEEPTRFGVGCLGSRLLSGTLCAEAAQKLTDAAGAPLDEVRASAGFTGTLAEVKLSPRHFKAFVELHIEQGPLLEQQKLPIGIVNKIAAPASLRLSVEGAGGHAGAVLMHGRRDALCAAAEIILAVENEARNTSAADTVATVGICEVFPGAVNSIPSRVQLSVDVRDTDEPRRDRVLRALEARCRAIANSRQVAIHTTLINADAPATCDATVIRAIEQACETHQLPFLPMISRAYHDSLFMARIAPVAMVFIPCRNGYSHRPDEFASPRDFAQGTLVLAESLATLAS
jgi:N-carbamoyl-L-amino-acid hydrolase